MVLIRMEDEERFLVEEAQVEWEGVKGREGKGGGGLSA